MPAKRSKVDHAWFMAQFESQGLSIRDVARELRIDGASLHRTLKGIRRIQVSEAIDLARLLRLPLREILERSGHDLTGVGL